MLEGNACPPSVVLEDLLGGKLVDPELRDLTAHLEDCASCQERANTLSPNDTLLESLRRPSPQADAIARDMPLPLMEKLKSVAAHQNAPSSDTHVHGDDSSIEAKALEMDFLSAPQHPDELGRLGPYRILKVLGKGGMGMVFLAEDPHLDRHVALKVMLPKFAANAAAKTRFLREAKAAAKLRSDHIVTIYHVGEERGVPFLAMELLEGEPLDRMLQSRTELSAALIARIGREIAQGLAVAHDKGLIHRDIKPSNLWLDRAHGDRVKILDFGLARSDREDIHLTQSGAVVGTPAFMAPEQGRGEKNLDARADLFSLGCVLYRMCTGDIPFKAESTMGILTALATRTPKPPRQISPNIPPSLSEFVMLLLEKEPARRPASARAVISRLAEIEQESWAGNADAATSRGIVTSAAELTIDQPPETGMPRRRLPMSVALLAVLGGALIGLAGIVFYWLTAEGRVVRIECDDPEIKIAFDEGELKIVGAYKEPLALKPGKHGLKIKKGDFEFETDKLIVHRGDKIVLRIEVQAGKVLVVQAGRGVLDGKDMPPPPKLKNITPRIGLRFVNVNDKVGPLPFTLELSKPFTLEAFAKVEPSVTSAAHVLGTINHVNLRANARKWEFNLRGTEKLSWQTHQVNAPLIAGKRVHVAGVFTGKEILFFVDGKLAGSKNVEMNPPHEGKVALTIGHHFKGVIDGVRVSQAARYTKEFDPPTRFTADAETNALYQFEGGTGDVLKDSSGNGMDGKIAGAKWVGGGHE